LDRRGRSDPVLSATTGLLVLSEKCLRATEEAGWEAWQHDVRLPALRAPGGARVATRFELTERPRPGMPGLGFTHVTILELDAPDIVAQAARTLDHDDALRATGRGHDAHVSVAADLFAAHGPHADKPEPSPALRGHILAHVLCSDPAREAEWDAWYDAQHVPDMLACGAFGAMTRWRRTPRNRVGSNHLTLYDVACDTVEEAVERSAAVMPGIVAAGRKHPCHTGALTLTLRRVGSGPGI
jgi:hypothetical protein